MTESEDEAAIEAWEQAAAYCTPADVVGSAVALMRRLLAEVERLREEVRRYTEPVGTVLRAWLEQRIASAESEIERLRGAVKEARALLVTVGSAASWPGYDGWHSKRNRWLAEHGGEGGDE